MPLKIGDGDGGWEPVSAMTVLADTLGMTRETVRRLAMQGILPGPVGGPWIPAEVAKWVRERNAAEAEAEKEKETLTEQALLARRRVADELKAEQVTYQRLRNRALRGELVTVASVGRAWRSAAAAIRNNLAGVPGRVAAKVAGKSEAEVLEILRAEIADVVTQAQGAIDKIELDRPEL